MKLLVADDERWIRKGILKMVDQGAHGFEEIFEAGTLAAFEEIFLKEKPEIVISDVRFPSGTSCELCQKLYESHPSTKFIVLSGYDDFTYVKAALGYKAVDYLLKPVDKGELNDTIRKAMEEWKDISEQKTAVKEQKEEKRGMENGEQIIRRIMEEVQKDCTKRFSLRTFSEQYHISEAYLSNLFAKVAGVSLMNYIMKIRVEKSVDLMLQTKMKINDIAEAVGYEDTRYFTRVFKKVTGKTPSDFRLRHREDIGEDEEERDE